MQTNTPIPFIRARTSPTVEKQILSMVTGPVLLISAGVGVGVGGPCQAEW